MTDEFKGVRKDSAPLSGAEFAGIGLQFGLSIVVFMFAGIWIDKRLGTSPWLLLVCIFAGGFISFYSLYRKVKAAQQREAKPPSAPSGRA
jgi:F0F1-type ATP synthase assembly protein I